MKATFAGVPPTRAATMATTAATKLAAAPAGLDMSPLSPSAVLKLGPRNKPTAPLYTPPQADRRPHITAVHGKMLCDAYHWLSERHSPAVRRYLDQENRFFQDAFAEQTAEFQHSLFSEMVSHIKETDTSVPVRRGPYLYYYRTEKGKQHRIYCRRRIGADPGVSEELLLNVNQLADQFAQLGSPSKPMHDCSSSSERFSAQGSGANGRQHFEQHSQQTAQAYFNLGMFSVSPDHKILAYAVDNTGDEIFTIYFKDLESGNRLPDVLQRVSYGLDWSNDSQTIFYCRMDEVTMRTHQILRHKIGTRSSDDERVYTEEDECFRVSLSKTDSEQFLLIEIDSKTSTEVLLIDANRPTDEPRVFRHRQPDVEYWVHHHTNGFFYIITNVGGATNFKLVRVAEDRYGDPSADEEVVPYDAARHIESIRLFKQHVVVVAREQGSVRFLVSQIGDTAYAELHYVPFPELLCSAYPQDNVEFDTHLFRFCYSSFLTSKSTIEYDMLSHTSTVLREQEVPGYNPDLYRCERLFAQSHDGTMVPISLVYRKDTHHGDQPSFMHLYGYGSYGCALDPTFTSDMLPLLDRGVIYAIAHTRGGGEMGRTWYDDGKLFKKKNTFFDFIACAEHLIAKKYTSPDRLAISGASAGGLLMGVVVNMRPELFRTAIIHVPFLDVINTMLDPTIPLTTQEYDEWGNPMESREVFDYMLSYSPYDNIEGSKPYPSMLVTAGFADPRVQFWEPAKFVAKLRFEMQQSKRNSANTPLVCLKVNMTSGHLGAAGRYDYLKEIAEEMAFILDRFGITE